MPLTPTRRSEVNRRNAAHSTGPKTAEGKERSRGNATKHGLCIETIALPDEAADELRERLDEWNEHYQPRTPAERELIEMAVVASVQRRRSLAFQAAELSNRIRTAEKRWDEAREDEVGRLAKLMEFDPATAVRELGRTGHGCRWLIARWERLGAMLGDDGGGGGKWYDVDHDEAIRLQGSLPERGRLRDSDDAGMTHRVLCVLYPHLVRDSGQSTHLSHSDAYIETYRLATANAGRAWADDPAAGRRWLGEVIAAHLGALRDREARLRVEYDDPERAGASMRARMLDDRTVTTWMRYDRMHELAFHRAYGALMKGRNEASGDGAVANDDRECDRAGVGLSPADVSHALTIAPAIPGELVGEGTGPAVRNEAESPESSQSSCCDVKASDDSTVLVASSFPAPRAVAEAVVEGAPGIVLALPLGEAQGPFERSIPGLLMRTTVAPPCPS